MKKYIRFYATEMITCFRCGGTGKFDSKETCYYCKGAGVVPRDK